VPSVALDPDRLFFRDTASRFGRHLAVSPANSDLEHLCYGRIRLSAAQTSSLAFATEQRETVLLCLQGACSLRVRADRSPAAEGVQLRLDTYDALYVPRGSFVEVEAEGEVDLVECAAAVTGDYPLQLVRYEDVARSTSLKFSTGSDASRRDLNIVIGGNVQAGRLLLGFTRSAPGNWTSWPPHEHTAMLEEAYVYFDMPAPAFGIQLVYANPEQPELVRVVHDGDAVLMPGGFHPNVAAPGHSINFVWMMAARREGIDRQFGVVNVQPGFGERGSGLEASRR
jgi:5-deoxy-glucuronate isomerase